MAGDLSLLVIASASFLISLLPKILEALLATNNPAQDADESITNALKDYVLPDFLTTGDLAIQGELELCRRLAENLLGASNLELWALTDCLDCFESISKYESQEEFYTKLKGRARVPLPFNLIVESEIPGELEKLLDSFPERSFRVVQLGHDNSNSLSRLWVIADGDLLKVSGEIGGEQVKLILAGDSLTREPGDDFRNERPATSSSLDLVSNTSSKHRTTRSDKPKRFNFPIRRRVIDKAQTSFSGLSNQNQIGQGFPEQVGGANAIPDIATRLRQLGHGI